AMLAAHSKSKGTGGGSKSKGKEKLKWHCNNCRKDGHTQDQCFAEGGGKAGEAPDWWVKKNGKSKGKGKDKSANTTKKSQDDANNENYAFLILTDSLSDVDYPNVAPAITSGHDHGGSTMHLTWPSHLFPRCVSIVLGVPSSSKGGCA
ncbi:hypothetical protein DXG03_004385, partial [Asterophora parasitica]